MSKGIWWTGGEWQVGAWRGSEKWLETGTEQLTERNKNIRGGEEGTQLDFFCHDDKIVDTQKAKYSLTSSSSW